MKIEYALKPEPLPVEPSGVPGHRTTKSINPPGQYWYSPGTRPQKNWHTQGPAQKALKYSPSR